MKKILIIFVFMILFSLNVSANVNWFTWGNLGYNGAGVGVDNILWGSNYPQGNITLSNTTLAVASSFPPLIVDWNNDFKNEIIVFSGNTIGLYNNKLELLGTIDHGSTIVGQGCIFNYQADNDFELALMDDTNNAIRIYEPSGIDGISFVKSIPLIAQLYHDVFCTVGYGNDNLLAVSTTTRFLIVNSDTDEYINNATGVGGCSYSSSTYNYDNEGAYTDFDNDGWNEFVFITSTASASQIAIRSYDTHNNLWDFQTTSAIPSSTGTCKYLSLGIGNIGSITSTKEFIIKEQTEYLTTENQNQFIAIGNVFGTVSKTWNETHINYNFPSVADIDSDGSNELCFLNNSEYNCYSDSYVREYYVDATILNSTGMFPKFITIADYNTVEGFLNLVSNTGVYGFNAIAHSLTQDMIFNDSIMNDETMPISSAISTINYGTADFMKEILLADNSLMRIFLRQTLSVCGDGICQNDETLLSCYTDCFVASNPNYITLDVVKINPSTAYPWQNNTICAFSIKASSNYSSQVATNVVLYYGETFKEDLGWSDYHSSGSYNIITGRANHTVSNGYIKVSARALSNENITVSKLFGFSVVTSGGIVYGSGEAVFGETLNKTQVAEDIATTVEKGIDDMGGLSTASKLLIGLAVLMVSILAIAFYLGKAGVSGSAISIIIGAVSLSLTIAFTVLGLFPVWILFLFFMLGALGIFVFVKFIGTEG